MNFSYKDDYIKYRIEKAYSTLESAKLLAQNKFWNDCVNRLYYSIFYAINALLLKKNIDTKTHAGLKSAFNQTLIKTGILKKEAGKTFNKLYEMRNKGDYNDLFDFDENKVIPLIIPVEELINEVNDLLFKD